MMIKTRKTKVIRKITEKTIDVDMPDKKNFRFCNMDMFAFDGGLQKSEKDHVYLIKYTSYRCYPPRGNLSGMVKIVVSPIVDPKHVESKKDLKATIKCDLEFGKDYVCMYKDNIPVDRINTVLKQIEKTLPRELMMQHRIR